MLLLLAAVLVSRPKVPETVTEKVHLSRRVLTQFHQYDYDPAYIEAEAAYHRATADLEDYESGDPSISLERVTNDVQELWMDLAPFRNACLPTGSYLSCVQTPTF